MLGKTNITALKEGGTVTEIEDFSWTSVRSGIRNDFKMAVFGNGILAGVTECGEVAYTADGEVWETTRLEYAECKISDIEWDGERFILVGSCAEADGETVALAVATVDFVTVERLAESALGRYKECAFIHRQNGRYILAAYSRMAGAPRTLYFSYADLDQDKAEEGETISQSVMEGYGVSAARCTNGTLVRIRARIGTNTSSSWKQWLYVLRSDGIKYLKSYDNSNEKAVFECKDEMYVMELTEKENYNLHKVTAANEILSMCTGQNFGFVSGVYFEGCSLFINRHEMLIVRKGEGIADKTVEDLLEIAPEMSMSCIAKAFGRLFVFGNQGVILRSGTETNNEGALAVQTVSAKQALAEARKYTDERYAELAARIAALETV